MVIAPIPPTPPAPPTGGVAPTTTTPTTGTAGSDQFSNTITQAIDQLQSAQNNATGQAAQVAAGQGNIGDAMIAATQASVDTQVTQALITKAIGSFNDIMGMSF